MNIRLNEIMKHILILKIELWLVLNLNHIVFRRKFSNRLLGLNHVFFEEKIQWVSLCDNEAMKNIAKSDMNYILALGCLYNYCYLHDTHTIFSFWTSYLVTQNLLRLLGLNHVVSSDSNKSEACCSFHEISGKRQYVSISSQKILCCVVNKVVAEIVVWFLFLINSEMDQLV